MTATTDVAILSATREHVQARARDASGVYDVHVATAHVLHV